jgi:hypothetical protein
MLDDVVKGGVEGFIRGLLARKADESTGQIEAQSFVLRDGKGRGRAVLARSPTPSRSGNVRKLSLDLSFNPLRPSTRHFLRQRFGDTVIL